MTDPVARTFRKEEKLCSQKIMGELFLSGNSFLSYPFKIVWKSYAILPADAVAQAGFSVPKRLFKRSVDRNRLKRLMRESYRLHKAELYDKLKSADLKIALMLVYIGKEELPFAKIEPAIAKSLGKIIGQLGKMEEMG